MAPRAITQPTNLRYLFVIVVTGAHHGLMASRCLVIPFPMHRVRRRPHRAAAANAALDAIRELDALEHAQLKLCAWCFAMSAVLTSTLGLTL